MDNRKDNISTNARDILPIHKAPDSIWNGIDDNLNNKSNKNLDNAIANLPVHKADETIWSNISDDLDKYEKKGGIISQKISSNALKIAATVILLIGFSWMSWNFINGEKVEKSNVFAHNNIDANKSPKEIQYVIEETNGISLNKEQVVIKEVAIVDTKQSISIDKVISQKNEVDAIIENDINIVDNTINENIIESAIIEDNNIEIYKQNKKVIKVTYKINSNKVPKQEPLIADNNHNRSKSKIKFRLFSRTNKIYQKNDRNYLLLAKINL